MTPISRSCNFALKCRLPPGFVAPFRDRAAKRKVKEPHVAHVGMSCPAFLGYKTPSTKGQSRSSRHGDYDLWIRGDAADSESQFSACIKFLEPFFGCKFRNVDKSVAAESLAFQSSAIGLNKAATTV
jgi:hypothetical protein